jgi:hypothetical protein
VFSFLYNVGKTGILDGSIDLLVDVIKVALVGPGYSADKDGHEFLADVTNEVSGTGYAAGGKEIDNLTVAIDNVHDRAALHGDDVVWSLATFTARGAVIYKATGSAATSRLIAFMDFGEDKIMSGEDFSLNWNSEGILYLGE